MTAAADFLTLLVRQLGDEPSALDVVSALVPEVADLAQVFLLDGNHLRLAAYRHINPEQHPVLDELARVHRPRLDHPTDPVAHVMRTREARLSTWIKREHVERATADARVHAIFDVIQPRNIVIVPLELDSDVFGAIVVAMSSSSRRFMEGDLEFMRGFAKQVSRIMRRE